MQTIAHYRVTEKLGAGGMGEVYRATGTKLNRDVALKVLPEELAKDADRMARLKREAQVLASLNHPNIAAFRCGWCATPRTTWSQPKAALPWPWWKSAGANW